MPGITIKALKEMLSPTKKMDADTCDGSTDDNDNNDCPRRDCREEACPPPVDQQSKVTPSKKMDADTCGGSTDDIDNNDCLQRDGTEEACTPPVDHQSKVTPSKKMDADTCGGSTDDIDNNGCPQRDGTENACTLPGDQQKASLNMDVKGAVNSDVKNNYTIGQLYMQKEELRKDVTMDYVQGAEPKIDISVPAKEGETIVHVECTKNEMSSCCYRHYDGREWPFRSKWTFENVPHGLIKFIMKKCPTYFELTDELEKRYRSKFEKMHNKSCLVVEFLHDTEEDRDRMMQDQENVKTMFMEFLHGIGKDAPSCSLKVCSEPATVSMSDEDVKEIIGANPRDTKFTNTSDSDSDSFFDAADEMVEDTEQAANLPSTSLTEDAKERIGLNPEGTPPIKTAASDSEYSWRLSPVSSETKRTHAQTEVLAEELSRCLIGGSKFDSESTMVGRIGRRTSSGFRAIQSKVSFEKDTSPSQKQTSKSDTTVKQNVQETVSAAYGTASASSRRSTIRTSGYGEQDSSDLASMVKALNWLTSSQYRSSQYRSSQYPLNPFQCTYCDGDYREQRKGHIISLKSLARSALRLHPLPASAVKLYDCTTCSRVCGDANYQMGTEDNVFFIHLHQTQVDRTTQGMKPSAEYQFKKALSSMRNSGGGALFVHHCKNISRPDMDEFQSTVVPVLGTMLNDDEIMSDGFGWHRLESEEGRVYKIDVLPSDTFITADMKTKLVAWYANKQVCASFDKLKPPLLSSRKVPMTEPTIQGLPHMSQANAVKVYVGRTDDTLFNPPIVGPYFSVSAWVDHIFTASLPEYVTSISKRKQGGSVYVGRTSYDNKVDMDGIPFPTQGRKHEMQSMLTEELQKKIGVFKNKYSDIALKPKDVFQIEIHDTGTNSGIIEVAVRPVDGCVFTDALGPASFRIENKSMGENHYKAFVRLPFDEWVEMASG